jgi:hypothetical protein
MMLGTRHLLLVHGAPGICHVPLRKKLKGRTTLAVPRSNCKLKEVVLCDEHGDGTQDGMGADKLAARKSTSSPASRMDYWH